MSDSTTTPTTPTPDTNITNITNLTKQIAAIKEAKITPEDLTLLTQFNSLFAQSAISNATVNQIQSHTRLKTKQIDQQIANTELTESLKLIKLLSN